MKQRYTRQRSGFLRRSTLAGLLVCIFLLPVVILSAPAAASYRSDRILIKPKAGVSLNDLAELHAYLGNRVLQTFPRMGNWQVLRIPRGVAVPNVLKAYKLSGFVQFAEPDYILHISMEPDDFHYQNGDQWNLKNLGQYDGSPGADIDATNGWDIRTSASNIIVAVIDTGVRYTHEDLAPNMWHNPQENQDGYTNDLYGINLTDNGRGDGDPWDDYGHGTHVAGIIGAAGNNGEGIAGVCWDVRLMALKFIDATGNGSVSDAITCINYAASHGAKIINASWGSYDFTSAALWDSINTIRNEGIIFVAAAGNDANNNDAYSLYPATYCESLDNVIAVAATDRNDALAPWSNYGLNSVQIAAPGDPVFSCWNGSDSDYQYYQGTSMAAPQVAGACALVWAQFPKLTALQVMKRVLKGVDLEPGLTSKCETGGRLNLFKALTPPVISKTPPPATNVWVDDSLPGGAESTSTTVTNYDANDNVEWIEEPWNWIAGNPAPFSGAAADQSASYSGIHRQSFDRATNTLTIYSGDNLFVYVYLDPTDPPGEIMIEWNDGCWEHRAFWGEDDIPWGQYGTSDRLDMGDLPPAGQWVRLEVPASALKLEGAALQGMSFVLDNGRATWDYAGRQAAAAQPSVQNLFVADSYNGNILEFAPDGSRTTYATGFGGTTAFGFDRSGNLFVGNGAYIYKVAPDGTQSILGESGTNGGPLALAVDQAGNVFEGNGNGNVYKFTPDGTRSVFAAGSIGYDRPWALTFDGAGDLFESDIPYSTYSSYFYEYAPDGTGANYTINAVMAAFGMTFDSTGNFFVADARNGQVCKIAPDKTWSVIATGFDLPYGVAVDNSGDVFVSDASRNTIYKIAPDGTQSVFATGLNYPTSMVFASPPGH